MKTSFSGYEFCWHQYKMKALSSKYANYYFLTFVFKIFDNFLVFHS